MPPPTLTSARVAPDGQPPIVRISSTFESGRREKALAAIAANSVKAAAKAAEPPSGPAVNDKNSKALQNNPRLEAGRYFIFVVLFCVSALINMDSKFFWFKNAMLDVVKSQNFDAVVSRDSFWDYAASSDPGSFLSNLFTVVERLDSAANSSSFKSNSIFLISPLRIRTLRVTPGPCFPKGFNSANLSQIFDASRSCNPTFFTNVENKLDYGENQIFSWSTDPIVNRNLIGDFGELAFYPGGGYSVTINESNALKTAAALRNLQHSGFLDATSSYVALEFNVFAPIALAYLPVRVYFEFPSIGGAISGANFSPTIMFRYATSLGQVIQGIDAALIVYFIVSSIYMAQNAWRAGFVDFFKSSRWNAFDLICNISLMVNLGLRFNMNNEAQTLNLADPAVFTEISQFVVYERSITAANAFTLLLVLVRVCFFYGRHFPKASLILSSCEYALSNLIVCTIVLFATFLAFTASFYVCFGSEVSSFRSFGIACLSMLKALMGNTDEMVAIPSSGFPIIGPILIILYAVGMYFILINLFAAILVDAFIATNSSWNQQEKIAQIKKLATQKNQVGNLRKKIEEDFSDDDIIDREELEALVNTYKDLLGINTVEEFLDRYDDNHDGVITRAELIPLQAKLDKDLATIMEGGDIRGALTSEGMIDIIETFDQSIDEKLENITDRIMRAIEQRSFGGSNSAAMGIGFEGGQGILPVQNRSRDLLSSDTFAASLIGTVKAKSQFLSIKKRFSQRKLGNDKSPNKSGIDPMHQIQRNQEKRDSDEEMEAKLGPQHGKFKAKSMEIEDLKLRVEALQAQICLSELRLINVMEQLYQVGEFMRGSKISQMAEISQMKVQFSSDMNVIASCASVGFDALNMRMVETSDILQRVVTLLTMK